MTPQFTHQHSWGTGGRNDNFFPASLMQQATAFVLRTFLRHMEQIWATMARQLIFSWWCLEPQASVAYEKAGWYTVNMCRHKECSLWWKEIKSTESPWIKLSDQLCFVTEEANELLRFHHYLTARRPWFENDRCGVSHLTSSKDMQSGWIRKFNLIMFLSCFPLFGSEDRQIIGWGREWEREGKSRTSHQIAQVFTLLNELLIK